MTEALDPQPLLQALAAANVAYIIIGGFAVNAHGVIRPSKDLDIVPDPAPANLQRLAKLLRRLDASHVGLGDFNADEFRSTRRTPRISRLARTSIAMKRAAGRPRDLDDLARLTGA